MSIAGQVGGMSALPSTAHNHRNLAALVFVNFLWAAQYPAYKVASDHMSVATLNFWSFVCSIALLLPFLLLERGDVRRGQTLARRNPPEFGSASRRRPCSLWRSARWASCHLRS